MRSHRCPPAVLAVLAVRAVLAAAGSGVKAATFGCGRSVSQRKQKKKRAVRQNSNVFAMFDQNQIGEFKEAFSLIDHDNDGFLDKEDIKDMLASL
eukprot:jgi/Hompol1/5300/HPOL_004319-RA